MQRRSGRHGRLLIPRLLLRSFCRVIWSKLRGYVGSSLNYAGLCRRSDKPLFTFRAEITAGQVETRRASCYANPHATSGTAGGQDPIPRGAARAPLAFQPSHRARRGDFAGPCQRSADFSFARSGSDAGTRGQHRCADPATPCHLFLMGSGDGFLDAAPHLAYGWGRRRQPSRSWGHFTSARSPHHGPWD
jgi:hypothetical protein